MKAQTLLALAIVAALPAVLFSQTAVRRPMTLSGPAQLGNLFRANPFADSAESAPSQGQPVANTTSTATTEAAQKLAAEATRKQARMRIIQKLQFDRRPSAILRAWAESNKDPEESDDEEKSKSQTAATPNTVSATGTANATGTVAAPYTAGSTGRVISTGTVTSTGTTLSSGTLASTGTIQSPNKVPSQATIGVPGPAAVPGAVSPGAVVSPNTAQPAAPPVKPDWFNTAIKIFQRDVTLGNWPDVKHFLIDLPEDEGKALYKRLLQSLQGVPSAVANLPQELQAQFAQMQRLQSQQRGRNPERNTFKFEDVIALANVAPLELDDSMLRSLAIMLRETLKSGNVIEPLITRLQAETAKPEYLMVLSKRKIAKLLLNAGRIVEAGDFLPDVDQATEDEDFEALNLLSQYLLALHKTEKKVEHLERAWEVTQAVLAADVTKVEQQVALKRAVDLAPRIRDELGLAWLEESFTTRPQRGMEILAAIGTATAQGLATRGTDSAYRLKSLQLQTTSVEALLKSAPELAQEWSEAVDLLAGNWLREATTSYQYDQSTRRGPSLRRDSFGNYFYSNDPFMSSSRSSSSRIVAIKTGDLLEIKPSDEWLALVSSSLKPKFDMVFAQLHLKVNEEDQAFPYIEQLANVYPDLAKDLVDEFLRVWTQNHDPNANRNRTNYYMFNYGYSRRAESIPLTRSKQERNLKDLAKLVERLRALPLDDLNEELLASAFTTCHSSAEVYRLEAIERVFGSLDEIDPKTLAELSQKMRSNLIGVWRQPAVQKDKQTKRKQKDIQTEVLRGYAVARAVIDRGMEKHPDHWALQLAKASLEHDANNYRKEIAPDSKFSQSRDEAFSGFERAAELYAAEAAQMDEEEQTTKVYELWYYASLGACDLAHVDGEKVPDLRQPKRIREAILALPGAAAEHHVAMFANTLFTRMSAVKPAVKFRYIRTGLEIVGDHKQAREARKVYEYYKDLVTEIKLETVIDGTDVVGHTEPFGVFVNLRHTREIERESGGFGRYLQNQNNGRYYNYGRPVENYRDKFEEIVQQAVEEHFELLSVTFQSDDVNSKATEEYGWRVTPYAYLLLKSRGPEVDKLPSIRLDLDFLDTSGYAIIPVESPALPIDSSPKKGDDRPLQNLKITQTLDERQADEGKLILEIKATAQGLVPKLEDILDLVPAGFDLDEPEDEIVSVSRFDPDSDETVVVTERSWMVTMHAQSNLPERPTMFQFGEPKLAVIENIYQRYDDADLLSVAREISLQEHYGETSYAWLWPVLALLAAGVSAILLVVLSPRRTRQVAAPRFELPDAITPFTVLGLLRQIEENNGFDMNGKQELALCIDRLEQHYFFQVEGEEPSLEEIVTSWIRRSH